MTLESEARDFAFMCFAAGVLLAFGWLLAGFM